MNDPRSDTPYKQRPSGLFVPAYLSFENAIQQLGNASDDGFLGDHPGMRGLAVVPGYRDIWGTNSPEIKELFSTVTLEWWLEVLSRLGAALLHETAQDTAKLTLFRTFFQPSELRRLDAFLQNAPRAGVFEPFSVLFAIQLACVYSSSTKEPHPLDDQAADRIVQGILILVDLLNAQNGLDIQQGSSGWLAGMIERSSLGGPLEHLATAYGLWLWDDAHVTSEIAGVRQRFNQTLETSYSLNLRDWIVSAGLVSWVSSIRSMQKMMTGPMSFQLPLEGLSKSGNQAIRRFFTAISITLQEFVQHCRKLNNESSFLDRPTLLPLKQYPAMVLASEPMLYRVLSANHIAEAAIERPVRLRESASLDARSDARREFGLLFEAYVHGLLARTFGDRYQRLPPHKKRPRAEGIVWYPNGVIIVECKGRRVSELRRFQMRSDVSYANELEGLDLQKAVRQIQSTGIDILNGRIQRPTGISVKVIGAIIVCYQELPQSILAKTVMAPLVGENRFEDGVLWLRAQFGSIKMIENLDGWEDLNLLSVLYEKMADDITAFESLRNYFIEKGMKGTTFRTRRFLTSSVTKLIREWT